MEFKTVDYKIYFIERSIDYLRQKGIEYKWSEKSKKWANDFEGELNSMFNSYNDNKPRYSVNKRLIKTIFVGDQYNINELYEKCKLSYEHFNSCLIRIYGENNITDDIIKSHFEIIKPNKPKTYPKYNNEIKFKYRNKFPEITKIYFDGIVWMYKLKNIGHEYDYISETELDTYNLI